MSNSNVTTNVSSTSITITQIVGGAYLYSPSGICKIIQVIGSFIGVLLVGIGFYGWVIDMFEVAASFSIVLGVTLLILYLSALVTRISVSMNRLQFIYHAIWSVFYFIAVIIVFTHAGNYSRVIAGGVFGLIAVLAHIADCWLNYKTHPLF